MARWILQHFCSDWSEQEAILCLVSEGALILDDLVEIAGNNSNQLTILPILMFPQVGCSGKWKYISGSRKVCGIFLVVALELVLGGDHPKSYKADYICFDLPQYITITR